MIEAVKAAMMLKGFSCDVMVSDNGEAVATKMKSNLYTKVIFYGLTDAGFKDKINMFQGGEFLTILPIWIRAGGKFILHGEGSGVSIISDVLVSSHPGYRDWHFCGDFYRRCRQSLNKDNAVTARMPSSYSMKATMLSGVQPEHQLYRPSSTRPTLSVSNVPSFGGKIVSPKRTAIAAVALGDGHYVYIGDVNCEQSTLDIFGAV